MTIASLADFFGGIADGLEAETNPEHVGLPDDWRGWLRSMFPRSVRKPFGPHHEEFWDWLWAIESNRRPRPFVGAWPRGGGKSASAELGVAALGARNRRRYVVYVSETQGQADKRVQTISGLLESEAVTAFYPALGRRSTGKHGSARGWRRNRLWTASGFIVDALGLDTAARGLKVEDQRPDTIVLDDVDGRHDSEKITRKKRTTITESILPMGADDLAVLVLQNLIISTGIVSELVNGTASYLIDRVISGPIPAIEGLETQQEKREDGRVRTVITGGRPTWEGQDIEACQSIIDTEGFSAFDRERQHNVDEIEGALWSRDLIDNNRVAEAPDLKRIVIGVDPSGGAAEIGIVAVGIGYNGHGYVLEDWTQPGRLGPNNWATKAIYLYETLKADRIVAEKNFGGDMVENTLRTSAGGKHVPIYMVTSSRGKTIRAEPAVGLYQQGLIHHVGTHPELETEQTRWIPGIGDSPNRLDACLAPDTPILTSRGWERIDQIEVGRRVLTRVGWKPVLAAKMTSDDREILEVELSNGEILRGTAEHLVWRIDRGWVRLDSLVFGDTLLSWTSTPARSNTKEWSTGETPRRRDGRTGSTTGLLEVQDSTCFIEKSSRRTADQSRLASLFTIGTETLSITIPRIWRLSVERIMRLLTRSSRARSTSSILLRSAPLQPSGIAKPVTGRNVDTTFASRARSVENSSGSRNTAPYREPAAVSVVRLSVAGRGPVWNLEVADQPEYFAAGVLVHNCVFALTELFLPAPKTQHFTAARPPGL